MISSNTIFCHKYRKLMIENFGGKCSKCGSTIKLEFHHVVPTKVKGYSRGSFIRLKDVKNNGSCYILLCHSCHKELD